MVKKIKNKTVGILGGMGPEATVDLTRWIVKLTYHDKETYTDSEHIPVLVHNNPNVPSRVKAILENANSPAPTLIKMAKDLESIGANFLVMPCNTATYFVKDIQKRVKIPIVNMIRETANYIFKEYPNIKKVGLLATEATIRTNLYQKILLERKVETIYKGNHSKMIHNLIPQILKRYKASQTVPQTDFFVLSPNLQVLKNKVTKAIFGKHGIKAGYKSEPSRLLASAANQLARKGAEVVIMGCTEIPLVLKQKHVRVELINPTKILAQTAIDLSKGKKDLNKV